MGYIYVCNRRVTHSENVAGTHNRCAWRPDSEGDPASAGARTPACRRACLRVCRYPARNLQTYSAFDPGGIGPGAPERSPTNLRAGSVRRQEHAPDHRAAGRDGALLERGLRGLQAVRGGKEMTIRKSIWVGSPPEVAFKVFCEDIGEWWPGGFGGKDSRLCLECEVGGRFFEGHPDGTTYEIGRVTAYQPVSVVAFSWRAPSWNITTQVEVRFSAEAGGTRIELEHSG